METSAAWLEGVIHAFCRGPENMLPGPFSERTWDAPLVGFADGADALYEQYKHVVGPSHWSPLEAFLLAWPGSQAQAQELTVVSWILP